MSDSNEQGLALEKAIEKIETSILRSNPSLKDDTFKIETRKIINDGGVRHEIDVFVSIDHGKGYNSTFIFEAKNWKDKVGKNEIIVFQEKIKASSAQKGFFVAKEFTKDAENQAAKEPRMELAIASDDFDTAPLFPDIHVLVRDKPGKVTLELTAKKDKPKEGAGELISLNQDTDLIMVDGVEKPIKDFVNSIYEAAIEEKLRREPTQTYPGGEYELSHKKTTDFDPPLGFKGKTFEQAEIEVTFPIKIVRPSIVSRFDVASRGRVVTFETVEMSGGAKLDLSFITH
jgi:hypothetical protein